MTPDTASAGVRTAQEVLVLMPQARGYEYFDNPDVRLGTPRAARVAASQAFVGQTMIKNGEIGAEPPPSERTLLAPAFGLRFPPSRLLPVVAHRDGTSRLRRFVWGATSALKAFQRYGFNNHDCFCARRAGLSLRRGDTRCDRPIQLEVARLLRSA